MDEQCKPQMNIIKNWNRNLVRTYEYILILLVVLMVSCDNNNDRTQIEIAQCNKKPGLFWETKRAPMEQQNFSFTYTGDSITYKGMVGYLFRFVDKQFGDSIHGYWGLQDSTLYFWAKHSYQAGCFQIIPFGTFKRTTESYRFCEQRCYRYARLTEFGSCVQVNCKFMGADDILVRHTLFSMSLSHEPVFYREYRITRSRGIVHYQTDFNYRNTILDFPY